MAGEQILQGMTLGYDLAGGTSYTTIGSIVSFSGPGASRTAIQIGAADSANSMNTAKAGRSTRGTMQFTVNLDPDDAAQARIAQIEMQTKTSSLLVATPPTWKMIFDEGGAGARNITFAGFSSGFDTDVSDDGGVTASFSVGLQSALTFGTESA